MKECIIGKFTTSGKCQYTLKWTHEDHAQLYSYEEVLELVRNTHSNITFDIPFSIVCFADNKELVHPLTNEEIIKFYNDF